MVHVPASRSAFFFHIAPRENALQPNMPETAAGLSRTNSHDFVIAYAAHLKRTARSRSPSGRPRQDRITRELPRLPRLVLHPAAAIARRVYLGAASALARSSASWRPQDARHRPEHFGTVCPIAPHPQGARDLKIIEKVPNGKGRRISPQGQRDLDSIAGQIADEEQQWLGSAPCLYPTPPPPPCTPYVGAAAVAPTPPLLERRLSVGRAGRGDGAEARSLCMLV